MEMQDGPERQGSRARASPSGLLLLVEDDFVLRSSLTELLNAEGFRVDCCADGREAFRRLHVPPRPDLILLDIMLPYLDGFEFRALQRKSSPHLSNIPVVAISAYDLDPQSVDELGLHPAFRKPLEIEKLLAHVRERIATAQGGARS